VTISSAACHFWYNHRGVAIHQPLPPFREGIKGLGNVPLSYRTKSNSRLNEAVETENVNIRQKSIF
jgi:hypothetical protein